MVSIVIQIGNGQILIENALHSWSEMKYKIVYILMMNDCACSLDNNDINWVDGYIYNCKNHGHIQEKVPSALWLITSARTFMFELK